MNWPVKHLTQDEAVDALRAAAFTVDYPESGDHGRTLIHSFIGGFIGADHDLDFALARVAEADEVAWATHPIHHDLAVRVRDRVYRYSVRRPERADPSDIACY